MFGASGTFVCHFSGDRLKHDPGNFSDILCDFQNPTRSNAHRKTNYSTVFDDTVRHKVFLEVFVDYLLSISGISLLESRR